MTGICIPYRGKYLEDYKVNQEINSFFFIYDLFSGDTSEEEELKMYEDSFKVHTRDKRRIKRVKRWCKNGL